MRAVVASDSRLIGGKVREFLLRGGHECQLAELALLPQTTQRLIHDHPDLLVVTLSPDPERGLTLLREVRPFLEGRVLVVGPSTEPRLILRAQREGADQYLDEAELEMEFKSVLPRLHTDNGVHTRPGALLAVMGVTGDGGVSTLAVNLAACWSKGGETPCLLDVSLETGDLAVLLNLKPTHSLAEFCHNTGRMDRSMFEQLLVRHTSGIHLLAAPRQLADISSVTPQGVRHALAMAQKCFPYVIADLDRSYREEQTLLLQQAGLVCLVFRLDFTSLRNTRRVLEWLQEMGLNRERVHLVANRYGQPGGVPPAKAEEALGRKLFHLIPDEPKAVNRANSNGAPVVLEAPRAGVSKSIARLAAGFKSLLDALKDESGEERTAGTGRGAVV